MPLVKTSYGIACCRRRVDGSVEILLVQKSTTHEFSAFVHAHYDRKDTKYVMGLFNRMSTDEKNTLLSLDFAAIWYRLFGEGGSKPIMRTSVYNRKKGLFMKHFALDGGLKLRAMLNKTACYEPPWEPPKGHRNAGETSLEAARREFMEETGACIDDFVMLPTLGSYKQSFMDAGVTYNTEHFFAVAKPDWSPQIMFNSEAASEIAQIRWMTATEVQSLNLPNEVKQRLCTQCKKITSVFRNRVSLRELSSLYMYF